MNKRIFSLLTALVLALSLTLPAFAAGPGDIVILYTNDVHCGVDDNLGYAALAGYKAQLEAEYGAEHVTLVDLGDAVQGDVIGALSDGAWIIELMNQVGYDLAIPGNHEFDYGMEQFFALTQQAEFPYLCCNFLDLTTGETVFEPYRILSYSGVQVGFVGIDTPESIIKSTPTHFQDEAGTYIYDFCGGNGGQALYDRVQMTVDAVRAQGADYVIALGHLGIDPDSSPWTSTEVIAHTTGIDVLLDGHSHSTVPSQEVVNQAGEPVLLSQTGSKLAAIGQLTIASDGTLSAQLITDYDGSASPAYAETSAQIQRIQGAYEDRISQPVAVSEVLLTTGDPNSEIRLIRSQETNLGDLCADAYRVMLGADIGWVNGGGIRAELAPGTITYGDIIKVHPYGNMICLAEVSGQQILDALELACQNVGAGESGGFLQVSGLTFGVDQTVPSSVVTDDHGMFVEVGGVRRIYDVQVLGPDGQYSPLAPEGRYSLACHDYMLYSQGDGFSMFGKDHLTVLKDRAMVDSDVLIRYIAEELNGVVTAEQYGEAQGRIRITGAAEPVAAEQQAVYVVAAGDTLWGIAQRYYGTGTAWLSIFEANRDVIQSSSLIYPGQVLILPAA